MNLPSATKLLIKRAFLPHGMRPYRIRGGAAKGMRFHFNLQEDTQVWRGIYEQALQEWLVESVKPDAVCIDVGAAEGWATLLMATLCPMGIVYAFEPSARGDWIEPNLSLNQGTLLGEVRIRREFVGESGADDSSSARTVALDDVVTQDDLSRVDIVKIDVDGPENDVLDGARQVLEKYRPAICVEAHSHNLLDGVLNRLRQAAYEVRIVDPPTHEHRPIEYNPMVFAIPCLTATP